MIEILKSILYSLVKLIGDIWGIHIVIAALLYPRPLLPIDEGDVRETPYRIITLIGGTLLLFINVMVLVVLLTHFAWLDATKAFSTVCCAHSSLIEAVRAYLSVFFSHSAWINVAKIFFVFYTCLIIGAVIIAFNHISDIYDLFTILEKAAIQSRDDSAMLIRATEARLEAWDRTLMTAQNTEISFAAFFKKAAPLIMLFLRKEKSMLHIGLEAFKLVCSNTQLFKNLF